MACPTIKQAIVDLYYWQRNPRETNFSARLYGLMAKADEDNMTRLAAAFPIEYTAYTTWKSYPGGGDKFFKDNKVPS